MKKSLFSCVSAALVGAIMFAGAPVSGAMAAGNQNNGTAYHQSGQDVGNWRERRHDDRIRSRYFDRATCQPREAVYKAQRFGLRNAEINRINRHLIVVSGRKHGQRLIVGMERDSGHCDIAFVKRNFNGLYR